jgi:hypothetical protein
MSTNGLTTYQAIPSSEPWYFWRSSRRTIWPKRKRWRRRSDTQKAPRRASTAGTVLTRMERSRNTDHRSR